jgi:hypothetical protein
LADSERYVNASLEFSLATIFNRTYFTDNFYALLAMLTGRGVAIHLATATLVTLSIWYVFKGHVRYLPRIFWFLLVLPFFAIWTSVVGKEALSICAFMLVVKWLADTALLGKSKMWLLVVGLVIGGIVRPNYAIPYVFMVLITYIFLYGRRQVSLSSGMKFSVGVYAFTILFVFSLFLYLCIVNAAVWEPILDDVMQISESYFLSYDGGANRLGIAWSSTADFFYNMYWGIPVSIIGPMPAEILQRPVLIPFFIEGIITLVLLLYYVYALFQLSFKYYRVRFFFYAVFLPAVCLALLIHYPLGIFNSGSAMRYKQSLVPLFYFLPILIILMSKRVTESAVTSSLIMRSDGQGYSS